MVIGARRRPGCRIFGVQQVNQAGEIEFSALRAGTQQRKNQAVNSERPGPGSPDSAQGAARRWSGLAVYCLQTEGRPPFADVSLTPWRELAMLTDRADRRGQLENVPIAVPLQDYAAPTAQRLLSSPRAAMSIATGTSSTAPRSHWGT